MSYDAFHLVSVQENIWVGRSLKMMFEEFQDGY